MDKLFFIIITVTFLIDTIIRKFLSLTYQIYI
jgi:hypothetical protein